jgi:hypothetical protein
VMGFSQGSVIFQLILEMKEKKLINWKILDGIKFFINLSSDTWNIRSNRKEYIRFEIPSLHFLSEEDFIFYKSIFAPVLYKDPIIIMHGYGHKFPKLDIK